MKCVWLVLLLFFAVSSYGESFVWQASKGGQTAYLAGTLHVLSKADLPLPSAYEEAYGASSVLYFETDMAKAQSVEFKQLLASKVHYPQGQTLLEKLDDATLEKLKLYMKSNGLDLIQFQQMRAGMVAITISMAEIMRLGMNQAGVDYMFYQKSLSDNKPSYGLEGVESQIDFLVGMGEGDESALIGQTLDEIKLLPQIMSQLREAYRKGDVETLDKLMVQEMKKNHPNIYQQLLVERNQKWLPAIEKALSEQPVEMILVGAAHLVGEDGLVQMLKNKGYTLKQL